MEFLLRSYSLTIEIYCTCGHIEDNKRISMRFLFILQSKEIIFNKYVMYKYSKKLQYFK